MVAAGEAQISGTMRRRVRYAWPFSYQDEAPKNFDANQL
jgi:hypothetical protein